MEEEEKKKEDNEKYNHIYFIENHEINIPVSLTFAKEYNEAKDLKAVKKEIFEDENTHSKYLISIFQFTTIPKNFDSDKKELEFELKVKLSEGIINTQIVIPNYGRDIFIYNLGNI